MNTQQIGAIAKEYNCELIVATLPGRTQSRSRKQNSKSNKANNSKASNTFLALRTPQSKVHYLGDLRILQTLNTIELRSAINETLRKAEQR